MTTAEFVKGIQAMTMLLPPQAEQLITLAPHLTEQERSDTLRAIQKDHAGIEKGAKDIDQIFDDATKEAKAVYRKGANAIQDEERRSAAARLDDQIKNA